MKNKLDHTIYKDLFKSNISKLTLEKLEEQIKKANYKNIENKLSDIENMRGLPMLITTFYYMLEINGEIPNLKDFSDLWIRDVFIKFPKLKDDDEIEMALRGRASRTYPSLIRDVHFKLYLSEYLKVFFENYEIVFNKKLDSRNLIDILIILDGKYYGLKLFTKTQNAIKYAKEKPTRNVIEFSNVEYISLTLKLNDKEKNIAINTGTHICNENCEKICKNNQEIYLYGFEYVKELKEIIENLKKKHEIAKTIAQTMFVQLKDDKYLLKELKEIIDNNKKNQEIKNTTVNTTAQTMFIQLKDNKYLLGELNILFKEHKIEK
jgi:hypothetical protein